MNPIDFMKIEGRRSVMIFLIPFCIGKFNNEEFRMNPIDIKKIAARASVMIFLIPF